MKTVTTTVFCESGIAPALFEEHLIQIDDGDWKEIEKRPHADIRINP